MISLMVEIFCASSHTSSSGRAPKLPLQSCGLPCTVPKSRGKTGFSLNPSPMFIVMMGSKLSVRMNHWMPVSQSETLPPLRGSGCASGATEPDIWRPQSRDSRKGSELRAPRLEATPFEP